MIKGFWATLKKPIMALAPMADVTDPAFRRIIAKYGQPDVTFTEFVSTDGLMSEGRTRLIRDLEYSEIERPIVAQIWGGKPELFFETAKLIRELKFDGIDINMGCPEGKIQKQGGCAALIKEPKLAQEIIKATMEGAGDLPVSVKTRIGYTKVEIEEWIPVLLETEPAAIILHGRTKKEMSKVPARWDVIARAAEIVRGYKNGQTLILGNGDVKDLPDADAKVREFGVDGVMIGRGIFGNPWLFNRNLSIENISLDEKLKVLLEFTFLYEKLLGDIKPFAILKKHFKAFVTGFDGAKELRMKMMEVETGQELQKVIEEYRAS